MKELNIAATTSEEQRIKAYLEENASDTLREKIENGVSYVFHTWLPYANRKLKKIPA